MPENKPGSPLTLPVDGECEVVAVRGLKYPAELRADEPLRIDADGDLVGFPQTAEDLAPAKEAERPALPLYEVVQHSPPNINCGQERVRVRGHLGRIEDGFLRFEAAGATVAMFSAGQTIRVTKIA